MTWTNSLKIAIIEKDIQSISRLTKTLPQFTELDKAKEALSLVSTAIELVDTEKQKILETMQKIKKTKEFLSS